jgi:hypothetical protein
MSRADPVWNLHLLRAVQTGGWRDWLRRNQMSRQPGPGNASLASQVEDMVF